MGAHSIFACVISRLGSIRAVVARGCDGVRPAPGDSPDFERLITFFTEPIDSIRLRYFIG
jgi:hypothetical protein